MSITAEYPYVNVTIDTSGLRPLAQRATGNVAVVGDAGGHGTALPNTPMMVSSMAEARELFAKVDKETGAVTAAGPLYHSLVTVMEQSPGPSRVYAVATSGGAADPDYQGGLATLAAVPVQFVCLARETDPARLAALHEHVETSSKDGNRRMAIAMVDPDLEVAAGQKFAVQAEVAYKDLKSSSGRMILAAARVATEGGTPDVDVAAAVMGAVAGLDVHISILMKQVRGVSIPLARQFSASEIKECAQAFILPLIDPDLIPGAGVFMGSGRGYTDDITLLYPDIVRTLDHTEFLLRAGLIGSIGNARIDRLGMQALKARFDGILQPLVTAGIIADYRVDIPVLAILAAEEDARTPGQAATLTNARTSRIVEVLLSVTYAGAVHFLDINLALKA